MGAGSRIKALVAGSVEDDSGRRVVLWLMPIHEWRLRQQVGEHMVRRGATRGVALAMLLSVPVFLIPAVLIPIASFSLPGWSKWIGVALAVPIGAAGPLAFVWILRVLEASRIARAMVALGRCASCGYELSDVPRDERGTQCCPECGAAWCTPATVGA
ncbi:MAG: hypothetical protein RBS39_04700 [Phycisphaerales bacterium]|jgi:hypothetical protein|nr:hypothetical protein [Phycisphaerales bacterium]